MNARSVCQPLQPRLVCQRPPPEGLDSFLSPVTCSDPSIAIHVADLIQKRNCISINSREYASVPITLRLSYQCNPNKKIDRRLAMSTIPVFFLLFYNTFILCTAFAEK